jgi:hypothetical protein
MPGQVHDPIGMDVLLAGAPPKTPLITDQAYDADTRICSQLHAQGSFLLSWLNQIAAGNIFVSMISIVLALSLKTLSQNSSHSALSRPARINRLNTASAPFISPPLSFGSIDNAPYLGYRYQQHFSHSIASLETLLLCLITMIFKIKFMRNFYKKLLLCIWIGCTALSLGRLAYQAYQSREIIYLEYLISNTILALVVIYQWSKTGSLFGVSWPSLSSNKKGL